MHIDFLKLDFQLLAICLLKSLRIPPSWLMPLVCHRLHDLPILLTEGQLNSASGYGTV